jgi:hypothetical protein
MVATLPMPNPSRIVKILETLMPLGLYADWVNTGGGVMCIVVSNNLGNELAFGIGAGYLGCTNENGDEVNSWPDLHLVTGWDTDDQLYEGHKISWVILNTVASYFNPADTREVR